LILITHNKYLKNEALATILCSILENNNNKYDSIDFKFAIICATNVSPEEKLAHYYDLNKKIKIPTLHIIGESDKLITLESSRHLTEYFIDPKLFIHDQGHMIPRDSEAKKAYNEFFEEMIKKFN
jgi:pimeloyl-ACP methyl ester carboxylesterase